MGSLKLTLYFIPKMAMILIKITVIKIRNEEIIISLFIAFI